MCVEEFTNFCKNRMLSRAIVRKLEWQTFLSGRCSSRCCAYSASRNSYFLNIAAAVHRMNGKQVSKVCPTHIRRRRVCARVCCAYIYICIYMPCVIVSTLVSDVCSVSRTFFGPPGVFYGFQISHVVFAGPTVLAGHPDRPVPRKEAFTIGMRDRDEFRESRTNKTKKKK